MNYLGVDVYKCIGGYDCTNGGVTSREGHFFIECVDGPWTEDDLANRGTAATILVEGKAGNRTYLKPKGEVEYTMFGGNFVYSSDSRFPYDRPVHVHDRVE